jgi:hypothetical protein
LSIELVFLRLCLLFLGYSIGEQALPHCDRAV